MIYAKARRLRELLDRPGKREEFETEIAERAAIMEHDGRIERTLAERKARAEVTARWLEEYD